MLSLRPTLSLRCVPLKKFFLTSTLRVNSGYTNSLGVASFLVGLASGTVVYVGVAASGYAENENLDTETL